MPTPMKMKGIGFELKKRKKKKKQLKSLKCMQFDLLKRLKRHAFVKLQKGIKVILKNGFAKHHGHNKTTKKSHYKHLNKI